MKFSNEESGDVSENVYAEYMIELQTALNVFKKIIVIGNEAIRGNDEHSQ